MKQIDYSNDKNSDRHVLHIITGLSDGGAEAVLFRLCSQDRTCRHHVVSLMDHGKYGPLLEDIGVPVTALEMPRGRITIVGLWKLWLHVRRLQPDAIQTWMYHADFIGGLIARLAGHRNVIWGVHNTTLVPGESRRGTILVGKLCALLSHCIPKHIICCASKSRLVHVALGYDRARICVIPNGYDLSVFRPDPELGRSVRKELGIDPETPLIGFVARFDPQKDHSNLLKAFSLLSSRKPAPRCALIGTGTDSNNKVLNQMISDLGLTDKVILVGRRSDIPAVMNALDIHVMSSSFGEAFPNVLAEAMACGTPCVSTDVGDAADIIGPTGLVVPPRSPESLATAIDRLLAERNTLAWGDRKEASRRHVAERFEVQRMIRSYHHVWFDQCR